MDPVPEVVQPVKLNCEPKLVPYPPPSNPPIHSFHPPVDAGHCVLELQ
jgi:hypothetical protein